MHSLTTFGRMVSLLMLVGLLATAPTPAAAVTVYSNDFQSAGPYPEWSSDHGTPIQATTPSGRKFLGRDPLLGFGAVDTEIVSLTLTGLAPHTMATLSFKVYVMNSMDGEGYFFCCGPDVFDVGVAGGPTLLHTTFSNTDEPGINNRQAYPNSTPLAPPGNPGGSGAAEIDTLGYGGDWGDSVYNLSFTFPHSGSTLVVRYTMSLVEPPNTPPPVNESFGLDDVKVETVVPEPSTLLLLGSGLVGFIGYQWRRRQHAATK